jgi:hypothetical protein
MDYFLVLNTKTNYYPPQPPQYKNKLQWPQFYLKRKIHPCNYVVADPRIAKLANGANALNHAAVVYSTERSNKQQVTVNAQTTSGTLG